jgi:hypothetical protein
MHASAWRLVSTDKAHKTFAVQDPGFVVYSERMVT